MSKIAKVHIIKIRRAGWPGYKVREISAGGRVMSSYEFQNYRDALRCANTVAREHGADLEVQS